MKRLALVTVIVAALTLAGCGRDDSETPAVTGIVSASSEAPTVDQNSANATLTVTLEDVSLADAPSKVLSTQTIELAGETFPVAFELPYGLGDIAETNTYRVAARVTSGGDVLMISDTVVPVITNGAPTIGVEVGMVSIADK